MSIDFHPELGPVTHHVVECLTCRAASAPITDPADAEAYCLAVTDGHAAPEGCRRGPGCRAAALVVSCTADGPEVPCVSLPDDQAHRALAALGLSYAAEGAQAGEVSAALNVALALAPHAMVPAGPGGDLGAALEELVPVVDWALRQGRAVVWA